MSKQYEQASVQDVMAIIDAMEKSNEARSRDRALINAQFNGCRPYTDKEVEQHQIQVNANFLEGYRIAMDANLQVNGALLDKDKFFRARCVVGKEEKRDEYSRKFTDNIHKALKKGKSGRKHIALLKDRNASLTLHGIGALVWMTPHDWMPRFVALEDLLIPTDTPQEFCEELCHFGVNAQLTPYQLLKLTTGHAIDPGWDIELVRKVIKSINPLLPHTVDLNDVPEKWESLIKQHGMYLDSDAVPRIRVTYFFTQNAESGKWHRKIVFRESEGVSITTEAFFYDSKEKPFADNIEEIIHVQYGDGNVVAPLKFHSVRGLGVLLYGVVELMNRVRCQFTQHVFEQLMTILRINNVGDRERPKVLFLHPYAVLEDGVTFVPPQERHQVDPKLVEYSMSQNRQIMGESAASYIQDIDTGTQKEQTLGEAKIKLQSANKIVGGMLGNMYLQENFYYEEIVRRFLKKPAINKDIEEFQNKCQSDGIPATLMTTRCWEVESEKVLGMGDQTLAIEEANALMALVPQLDPSSQIIVRRKYIATITRNSDLAKVLVPDDPNAMSKGRQAAEDVFATLMSGIQTGIREGVEKQDYVMAMAEMMAAKIQMIQQKDNVGTPEDIMGLGTVAGNIDRHLKLLMQDPANKELVTGMQKQLAKMTNDIKGFAQRQQQAAEAKAKQDAQNPEAMAKAQAMMQQAQVKSQIAESQAELKARIKTLEHQQKMQQQAESHAVNMQAQQQRSAAEQGSTGSRTAAELQSQEAKTAADIASQEAKTKADIAAQKAKTDAEIEANRLKTEAEIEALAEKTDAEVEASKKAAAAAPKQPPVD